MMIKEKLNRLLSFFNKVSYFVDAIFLLTILSKVNNKDNQSNSDNLLMWVAILFLVVLTFKYIRALVYIIKSRMDREVYLLSNRVVAITGKQRAGKSSIGVYFAKYAKKRYTNIPMRIKRKYTYKLTTDILTLKTKIDDGSIVLVDEANLFYNNTMSHEEKTLFGQALLCQCVGHFFDGNILYISTDITRMPKIIRDEWSTTLQVIRSRSYHYSIIGDSILKLLYFIVNKEQLKYTGCRMWECQQYEKIQEEQYISLLGQNEKNNHFSPFYIFTDFQDIGSVEYDDRYMRAYYTERPDNKDIEWDSLQLSKEDFQTLYDGLLSKYIKHIEEDKTEINKNRIRKE